MTTLLTRHVPLLNLRLQHERLRNELLSEITRVIDSGAFVMGQDVKQFEQAISKYCAVDHTVACASGSDALFLALAAGGVQAGDEVLTTPFSFFATAGAISRTGATPVFVDIDPVTYNIDPERLQEALRQHPRAKAIIPVHLFGACADMDPILAAARERGCFVIEDAAQAIGAEYKGRRAASIGDYGCLSFFPSKNLGAFGDAGMVTTPDADAAKRLATLRVHGAAKKYHHDVIGVNSRLDTLQAAVLLVKLQHLDAETMGRQRNARLYEDLLGGVSLPIVLPSVTDYQTRHIWNQFVIRCVEGTRDELRRFLQEHGVGTEIYYPMALHLQPCYRDLGYRPGDLQVSEQACSEVVALPIFADLQSVDIEYVSDLIRTFYR